MQIAPKLAGKTPFFYGWAVLLAASSSQFVRNSVASLTLAVFIYPIAEDLEWSRTLIAGAASLGGLAASGASPAVGWLVDRYGARTVLSASVLVLGLTTFSLGWATVPLAFYLAYGTGRVLFSSPLQIGASVVVSRWFVRQRGRATGLLYLAHSAGMVMFPLVASYIIVTYGWQAAWMILGIIVWTIALGPVSLLIVQRPEDVGLRPDGAEPSAPISDSESEESDEEPAWTLRQAVHTPTLWLLAIVGGSLFVIQAGTNIHLAAYFRDQGVGANIAAIAISVNAVLTGVGSIAWGWTIERLSVRHTYALVALIMGASSALFVTADTTTEALLFAGLFGFSLGGILVVPSVAFADYFGRRSLGAIRGITEPFTSLGQALGAVLSGAIYDATGSYQSAFWTFAAVAGVTAVIMLLTRPPRHTSPAASPMTVDLPRKEGHPSVEGQYPYRKRLSLTL